MTKIEKFTGLMSGDFYFAVNDADLDVLSKMYNQEIKLKDGLVYPVIVETQINYNENEKDKKKYFVCLHDVDRFINSAEWFVKQIKDLRNGK